MDIKKIDFLNFDWEKYLDYYKDLRLNNITDRIAAIKHYKYFGIKNNRIFFKYEKPLTDYFKNCKIYLKKKDNFNNFDWEKYINYYKDLRLNGIKSRKDAINHYIKYGKKAGRKFFRYNYISYLNNFNKIYSLEYLSDIIHIKKNNSIYRFGDLLRFDDRNHEDIRRLKFDKKFKNTILSDYINKNNQKNNFHFLYNLLKEKINNYKLKKYGDNYVFIHIRSGDAYKNKGLGNSYNFNFLLNEINKISLDKIIVIVTCMHYHNNSDATSVNTNINLLKIFISQIPNKVEILSNSDPDIDLIYLTFCKNLIISQGSGGFTRVASILNDIHNKNN